MPRKEQKMSGESLNAILEIESHTKETRDSIKKVRHFTRLSFTLQEKIRIVLDGFRHKVPIRDLFHREGKMAAKRSPRLFDCWTA